MLARSETGFTIIGAGKIFRHVLEIAQNYAPRLIAADGGANQAIRLGWLPEAIIGDLDSLKEQDCSELEQDRIHRISEQDSCDFDKCLRNLSAQFFLAIGFTGLRIDHELAVLSSLAKHPEKTCIVFSECDILCLAPSYLKLHIPLKTRVSLFPLAPVEGKSTGLRWGIEGIQFAPDGRIGTSNESISTEVEFEFSTRKMILILPQNCLNALLTGLGKHR